MKLLTCLFLLLGAQADLGRSEFVKGVNYGHRFIPEDWMTDYPVSIFGSKYGPAVTEPAGVHRVSFCDIPDDRILRWLDDTVLEDDFARMRDFGVRVVRVPTGYWNWVDLGGATPNAPADVAARFRNLQSVKPSQYEPYIDRVISWAEKYGMKVFLELHGSPGSQNGEIHSGCVTGPEGNGGKVEHYFDTDWNKQIALNSVEAIAKKCVQFKSACWGVGVINEPQPNPNGSDEDLHNFLDTYYEEAINKARETLPWEMPVVLFSWTYDMWRWPEERFPYILYGNVYWDTHLYTGGASDVNQVLSFYDSDLNGIKEFQQRQKAPVIIGEFAFSNLK